MTRLIQRHADKPTREAFQGIYPMDALPKAIAQYPFFMIVNTQAHNLPGEHWICVFIDKNRRGEVFDSLALPLRNSLIRWMNRFARTITSSHLNYQHPLSATCGAFVLYYILHRLQDAKCMSRKFDSSVASNETRIMSYFRSLK